MWLEDGELGLRLSCKAALQGDRATSRARSAFFVIPSLCVHLEHGVAVERLVLPVPLILRVHVTRGIQHAPCVQQAKVWRWALTALDWTMQLAMRV